MAWMSGFQEHDMLRRSLHKSYAYSFSDASFSLLLARTRRAMKDRRVFTHPYGPISSSGSLGFNAPRIRQVSLLFSIKSSHPNPVFPVFCTPSAPTKLTIACSIFRATHGLAS